MHSGSIHLFKLKAMKHLVIICLCALSCALTSCNYKSSRKPLNERKPLRYYKGHVVVAVYKSSNTMVLASDSSYINITVTDYELTTVALGDTLR